MARVFVVDDDKDWVGLFKSLLEGHDIRSAGNLGEAILELRTSSYDLLITDKNLGGERRGVRPLLNYMEEERPHIPVILASAEDGRQAQRELYCHGFWEKWGGSIQQLLDMVDELCPATN